VDTKLTRMISVLATAATAAALAATASAAPPTPPAQPLKGPGGAAGKWSAVHAVLHDNADDDLDYWTFEPRGWRQEPARKPDAAPVVFFLHGYRATDPTRYDAWIDHLVSKGSIVVYPRYQATPYTPTVTYTDNAIAALRDAVPWLRANAKPKPSLRDGVNVIGHSYGGAVAANVAARAVDSGLPRPASILLANPFVENATYKPPIDAIDDDLSGIPKGTLLDCIVADVDSFAGRLGCDEVFQRTGHLKRGNRSYVWMFGDDHGSPSLVSNHFAPSVASPVDALDYFGYWKLGDALATCALKGDRCGYAVGGGAKQAGMGHWSDGVPVRPLSIFSKPPACPADTQTYGC